MLIPNFVVFEGGDGSGTTTQLERLRNRFSAGLFLPGFHATFEPTDGPIGRLIRQALKGEFFLRPESLARLFAADRCEHLYGPSGVLERTQRGEIVVSDRYVLSSLVYQGITCGEELPQTLNASFPVPEALFFFDIDPQTACRRIADRAGKEIYEYLDFQIHVREEYKKLLPCYAKAGVRVAVIDASQSQEEVSEAVWRELQTLPIFKTV
ncbi:MAG: dTMP kinase [Spirochaetaceae bacterium]|jgi:dTMP kinase|nr:dTMP kinase [Spirochaetaceae bacterium]